MVVESSVGLVFQRVEQTRTAMGKWLTSDAVSLNRTQIGQKRCDSVTWSDNYCI